MNPEFSFYETSCLTKAEEPSLSYYLPIAGERIIGFLPFPRVLVLCEMQSFSSRIWTQVAKSISYNDNHYTTGTLYLERIIKVIYCNKQVIQCYQTSFFYLHPEWITVKCCIFIGRVHFVSKMGMISQHLGYSHCFGIRHLSVKSFYTFEQIIEASVFA